MSDFQPGDVVRYLGLDGTVDYARVLVVEYDWLRVRVYFRSSHWVDRWGHRAHFEPCPPDDLEAAVLFAAVLA